jgi:hypothetical protein
LAYKAFPFQPGIRKDDSPLDAEGWFIDCDKIRFVRGRAQTIGGQEYASNDTMTGVCRNIHTWSDNLGLKKAALGTHLRMYLMDGDGNLTDATPVVTRINGTAQFSSSTGSTEVVFGNYNSHGLALDQKIEIANASTTVGGVDVNGTFTVSRLVSSSSFAFEVTGAASASTTISQNSDLLVSLAPGLVDGLAGYGYGTGGYGVGGYGSSSSQSLFVRTWSLDNFGQNLLANPRGSGIYALQPSASATELVTATTATWTGSTTVTYNQSITTPAGAWLLARYNVSALSAGQINLIYNGSTVATSLSTGVTFSTFNSGSGGSKTLGLSGLAATGTLVNLSVKALTTANLIPNAPTPVTSMFVTNERIVVACGCNDTNGNFDPMRVRWSDQENSNDWTADPANLAGSYTMAVGSRIIRGIRGRVTNGIFTDTGLIGMTYTGNPNSVYRFDTYGTGCGLIGPNAVCELNGVFYWLTNGGEFYRFAGGVAEPLQSTVRRDVFDNLAKVQGDKVVCFPMGQWSEIWWLYPDSRDGNECSRYVIYNFLENTWSVGTFDRTAWADAGVYGFPMAASSGGRVYFQEKDFSDNGAPWSWSLTSGRVNAGDGLVNITGIKPNSDDLKGGYQITVTGYIPNDIGLISDTFGPFDVNSGSGSIGTRITAQQIQMNWSATDAPTFYRMGAFQADVRPSGARR